MTGLGGADEDRNRNWSAFRTPHNVNFMFWSSEAGPALKHRAFLVGPGVLQTQQEGLGL